MGPEVAPVLWGTLAHPAQVQPCPGGAPCLRSLSLTPP